MNSPEQIQRNIELLRAARERKNALGWGVDLTHEELDAILPDAGSAIRSREGRPKGSALRGKGKGCQKTRSGRWQAQIRINGRRFALGTFDTEGDARAAIEAKLAELGGPTDAPPP